MNDINFIKNIDNLGRIVIPMDIRRKLNICTGDVLSISCSNNSVILNKYCSFDNNNRINLIIDYFIEYFHLNIILVNKEYVIRSNVINNLLKFEDKIKSYISMGNSIKYQKSNFRFGDKMVDGYYNIQPIITNEGIIGSLIVLGNENSRAYDFCSLIVKLIELELNIS